MSLTSESMRRSVVVSRFHRFFLNRRLDRAGLGILPQSLRPLPEEAAVAELDSSPAGADDRIRSTVRAANCGYLHSMVPPAGVKGGDVVCHPVAMAAKGGYGLRSLAATGGKPSLPAAPRVQSHQGGARFDPDSLVTKAETSLEIENVTDELWDIIAESADPQKWQKNAPDFFRTSERVDGEGGVVVSEGENWKGRLHEVFEWNWNPETVARYENFLQIDYQVSATLVTVNYWLEESIRSDLGFGSGVGGLDVDEGELIIKRDGTNVTASATKSLRYTNRTDGPDGFVVMLSYLTPATLGVWLDQSLYQGALSAIEQVPDNVSGGRRPSAAFGESPPLPEAKA